MWFDRAVVLGQRTARTLQNRGTSYRDCGDTVAAEQDFRAALTPVPDEARSDPVVVFLTGLAQFARTDTERACEQLLAAVKGGLTDPSGLRIAVFILATHAQSAVLEAVTPQLPPALAMLSRQWHQHVHATALSQIGGDGERWHMLEAALRGTEPLPSAAMIAEAGEMTQWAGLAGWSRLFAGAGRGEAEPGDQGPQYILGLRSLQLGWF